MTERTRLILSFSLFVVGILWGISSLLIYIGLPIHQFVYWTADSVNQLTAACGPGNTTTELICRGTSAFFPFIWETIQMTSPFYGYIIVSLLLIGGIFGWNAYKTGNVEFSLRLSPLAIIGLFVASVWLIGTTLSLGSLYNLNTPAGARITDQNGNVGLQPFSRFYEPKPSLYVGAGEEALAELTANFEDLYNRGCLRDTGLQTQGGSRLFDFSALCVQGSMFVRVGTQIVLVFAFLITLLSLGRLLLTRALKLSSLPILATTVLSLGLGALGLVALLWLLTIVGFLTTPVVWALVLLIHAVCYRQTIWWWQQGWERRIELTSTLRRPMILLGWLLLSYLALNFLNVVRPFPIGWDDLGSYLNRPRLLSSYGSFIPSMSQFQWEYLTALGFLLFGYDSTVGATFAMQINWTAGLIAMLSVFVIARTFLGNRAGVLSAMMYYFLPMVGHFSFADMKIDNASFFTTALALLALLLALVPTEEHPEKTKKEKMYLLILTGLLIGFSFAIKPTAILGGLMILSILSGWYLGGYGFAGAALLGFAILQFFGALDIQAVLQRAELPLPLTRTSFTVLMILLFGGCMALVYRRHRTKFADWGRSIGMIALGGIVACVPWMSYNAYVAGSLQVHSLLKAEDRTAPIVSFRPPGTETFPAGATVRTLPTELALNPTHPACLGNSKVEELDRYWGFGTGITHYLTLPWRQVMNADGFGYYVTLMPALLLFPLLLLLPFFWTKEARWFRFFYAGTWVFLVQWAFVANGVSWYGIGMFLGLVLALEALIVKAPDRQNKWLFSFLIAMSIVVCLANRMWQFDTQKNVFEYPLGKINAAALREVTIPNYDDIRESMVSRRAALPDRPYTYRIGTFISYFIPQNREIFPLADHQMQFFNCLNQERDHALTLQRLKALGFNAIVFDTNTHTIEKDQNGPLHKKVEAFTAFVNDPALQLPIPINNPDNGIAYILLP